MSMMVDTSKLVCRKCGCTEAKLCDRHARRGFATPGFRMIGKCTHCHPPAYSEMEWEKLPGAIVRGEIKNPMKKESHSQIVVAPEGSLDLISPEQAQVIEVAKNYSAGFKAGVAHTKGYALLFGAALNQLKEITPHGQFGELAQKSFPEYSDRWLRTLMNYAEHRKLKTEVTSVLANGQMLLALPDAKKEKLFEHIESITGDKSIEQIAQEVVKAKANAKAKDAPPVSDVQKEKARQDGVTASFETVEAALRRVTNLKDADFVMASPALRKSVAALCVRFGKRMKATKAFKPKAK